MIVVTTEMAIATGIAGSVLLLPPAQGRIRLETVYQKFDAACRQIASHGERMRTTIFGAVSVEEYVPFMDLHTRHHGKQIAASQ